ncbi:hypothetical protein KCP70_24580 [Salmonella enterica subsp. enterica]|nr:hypothetical protein KCP70_24580 [Salmonella enterica subsp. enterica]
MAEIPGLRGSKTLRMRERSARRGNFPQRCHRVGLIRYAPFAPTWLLRRRRSSARRDKLQPR